MMMMREAMATLSFSPPHQWSASCCRPHSFLARNPNPLPWTPLVSSNRSNRGAPRPHQRRCCLCLASFGFIDRLDSLGFEPGAAKAALEHVETLLYSLADSVASADVVETQKQGGDWLSGLTNGMESVLKVLKDTLSSMHVPYSYGFAIILLTILVKVATLPLTKKQVESTLAMQNLSPKIKAIQQQYKGDQERIQLETARLYKEAGVNPLAGCLPTLITIPIWIGLYRALSNVANEGLLTEGFFWIPSLAGPTTVAARQSGSGISWLFPFIDGHPPLGWSDTLAYLVLPALLITSQYVSMQIMQTPQTNDPSQKNSQLILKFLPLMIGYFSLSVPSGLSLYWLTNNILSTGQQVWLKKLGGAKVPIGKDDSDITMSARQSLRSAAVPTPVMDPKEKERGERFKLLKEEEAKKKAKRAEAAKKAAEEADIKVAIISKDEEGKDSLDERHSKNGNGAASQDGLEPKESTASKQKTP